jgi:hypothetical protein
MGRNGDILLPFAGEGGAIGRRNTRGSQGWRDRGARRTVRPVELSSILHRIDPERRFWSRPMENEVAELDELQAAYKAAVEQWIVTIRREEALASVNHTVAQLDQWEQAHFDEDEARSKVLSVKAEYEDALRRKFFDF